MTKNDFVFAQRNSDGFNVVWFHSYGRIRGSLQNHFNGTTEDNLIFSAITFVPRLVLRKMGLKATYGNIAVSSFVLAIVLISANATLMVSYNSFL
ncbi:hypothetical protein [Roseibium album]|uniref:hypothetical protein n=1 Tax=Roseibium album TaxID=311410 RepID=UPI002492F089|nr:hypothetical protein [Roseibium album]